MNPNICHDRKLVFVHNPKAAGMSFRKWLGFNGAVNHGVPTVNTPYEIWNSYTVIVSVRDPIDRAVSCYRFMTDDRYTGIFKKIYPGMGSWDPLTYFRTIINEQLFVLACQYKYTEHFQSNKKPDFLFKFEAMDTADLARKLDIKAPFPKINVSNNKVPVPLSEDLYLSLVQHYKVDYLLFNYRPLSYSDFMERQEKCAA
jgi:hypothetical protein